MRSNDAPPGSPPGRPRAVATTTAAAPARSAPQPAPQPVPETAGRPGARRAGGKTPPLPRAAARDARVSRRARGFLAELWSHRPGWTFTVAALYAATRLCPAVEGKEALYRAVAELRTVGYVVPVAAQSRDAAPRDPWATRFQLNRDAAPVDGAGYVHVPWALTRDRGLSYRARGLLVERLADGATLNGLTVAVHRGGLETLAGRRPVEATKATRTALEELLTAGYAERQRTRHDDGRLGEARTIFRSTTETGTETQSGIPDTPVDNAGAAAPVPACDDAASRQVAATMPNPGTLSRETAASCQNTDKAQLRTKIPFSGPKGALKGSLKGEKTSGVRSVRSVHVPDARGHARPLRGIEEHSRSLRDGGSAHPRSAARPPVPRAAWEALARLPRAFRDDAPGWVRRDLARRLGRLIDGGHSADAIVATAARVADERPVSGDHIAALRAVHARLRADLAAGDICGACGGQRFTPHGRCPQCDDHRPLDAAEQRQLAAIWAHLTGVREPAASGPGPADWRPP